MRQCDGESGGFTLEFTIVFTLVFLASCLMAYVAVLMYERAASQAAADYAAISASAAWYDGEGASLKRGLYFRMPGSEEEAKLKLVGQVADIRFGAISLPGMTSAKAGASVKNGMLFKSVSVSIEGTSTLPERSVPENFSLGSEYAADAGGRSLIPDAPDTMRKIDFVADVARVIEETLIKSKIADSFSGVADKTRGYIGGTRDG